MIKTILLALALTIASSVPTFAFVPSSPITTVASIQDPLQSKLFAGNFDDEPKPLSIEGEGLSENEKVEAALAEFKQQSQIKAVAVLAIAFGTFVYLKLQYDADPSTFVGGH